MLVVAASEFAEGAPSFNCNISTGFRGQGQNHFRCIDRCFQTWTTFAHTRLGYTMVQVAEELDFFLGIPVDSFPTIAQFIQQTNRSEFL